MKKLLLLGGSAQQVVAIEKAKELGFYTVLCDFLEDNPGQYAADKFYLVSTTDKDAVLDVAEKEKVDGVLAYASDPAAPTAAYVAEKLNLPGNPYEAVDILCNKDKFRAFLSKNDFNTPKAKGYKTADAVSADMKNNFFSFPVIIKPTDSSGSKGVVKCENAEDVIQSFDYSMSFSHCKKVIVEEYIEKFGYQIAGDGLSIDGKLVFRCFANDHFDLNSVNPFVPVSASFPYNMPDMVQDKIHNEIQRLLTLLKMKNCTYNFDIRIDKDYNVYLMEIAPRDGGNYIPQIIRYAAGVDLIEYAVKMALGEPVEIPKMNKVQGFWSYYAVHSAEDGVLDGVDISSKGLEKIVENHLLKQKGDKVSAFSGANTTLGCLIMNFDSMDEMLDMMDHSEKWIRVKLDN